MRGRRTGTVDAAIAGYLTIQGAKTVAALRAARRAPAAVEPSPAEIGWVVVVQPVLSGDPGLEDALRDNVIALAGARFVWLVDADDAEGRRVADRVAADARRSAPSADGEARIEVRLCPPAPDGVNPKLFKLQPALAGCRDDEVFLVLDDDTRLPRPSLGALLTGLERATLATGLPAYLPGATVWARLVEQFVDNNAALTYLPIAPVTINGMTWAMRVGDLRALGGFAGILHNLTDDLAVAGIVLGSGGTICQTASPQWITTAVGSAGAYTRVMHRWMLFAHLLLRRQPPRTVGKIGLLLGTHPALLWVGLAGAVRARRAWPLAVLLGGRFALLQLVQRRIYGRSLQRPLLSLISELVQPAHVVHGSVQRTIRWRTRTYRVRSDDDFRAVEPGRRPARVR